VGTCPLTVLRLRRHDLNDSERHQRKALAMMVEKESGILRGAKFPSVWTEETIVGTGGLRYVMGP